MRQTRSTPVVERAKIDENALSKLVADVEQHLADIEKRLASLEMQAHTEHTIGEETLETIATHAIRRLVEQMQQVVGQSIPPDAE